MTNSDLVKALNRCARALERQNNEKLQRKLQRARVDELLKTISDASVIARVTAALRDIVPQPEVRPMVYPSLGIPPANPGPVHLTPEEEALAKAIVEIHEVHEDLEKARKAGL